MNRIIIYFRFYLEKTYFCSSNAKTKIVKTNRLRGLIKKYLIGLSVMVFFFFNSCTPQAPETNTKLDSYTKILYSKPSSQVLDSLFQQAQLDFSDSAQVDIMLKIYKKTIRSRPIRHDILDTAIFLAQKINYKIGLADGYNKKGLNYRYALDYQESVDYHRKALHYYEQTTDTFGRIKCLNSLGVSLRRMNYERNAMDHYIEALRLSRLINSDRSIAVALNGIGNVYVNIEQYQQAMPYFREALAIEQKSNNNRGINYDLSNIGEVFMYQNQYDSALNYYSKALEIANNLNHKDNASIIYNCIGKLYQGKKQYEKSNIYYDWGIEKFKEFGGKRYLSNTYINMGVNYNRLSNSRMAKKYITEGLQIAQEINSRENIILGFDALSHYYEKEGQYDLALYNYRDGIALRDSVNIEKTKSHIAELETIYENERKDNRIKEYQYQSELENRRKLTLWMLISFLVIAVFVLFYLYQVKRRNSKLEMEQMRNDIQEYIQRLEDFEIQSKERVSLEKEKSKKAIDENIETEKDIFYNNVKKYGLSEREMDVLLLISEGLKNDEIAEKLFLSVSTIKTHTRNIFIKLDVRNRIEAARKAQKP
ncbi:MAG: hypothetical protein B7C24_09550 [Bacteroidetes bacterium 4572_77]|nr:MAG: hypothetical protein B7C24_09550 [Bacteroidetes bacterium 4572_77]